MPDGVYRDACLCTVCGCDGRCCTGSDTCCGCRSAQRVTSTVHTSQSARSCQPWRARCFYDGVLTQWQFPLASLASPDRSHFAFCRFQLLSKREYLFSKLPIAVGGCVLYRKRSVVAISTSCTDCSLTLKFQLEAQRRARAAAPKSLLLSRDARRMWR